MIEIKIKNINDDYGKYYRILISYLFSLSLTYYIYSIIARTGKLIYGFPLNNDLINNATLNRYLLLIVFVPIAFISYFLYKKSVIFLMHAVSLVLICVLVLSMYLNSWFEYQNVLISSLVIFGMVLYIYSLIIKLSGVIRFRMPPKTGLMSVCALLLFSLIYCFYFIHLAVLRHNMFMSHRLDLAWENQALYNLTFTGIPYSSLGKSPNNLGDHTSFIYYLLSVFYRFYPRPEFLVITQVLAILFSAFAVFLIADFHLKSKIKSPVIAFIFLLFPSVQGLMLFDFHPIVLALPFLFFSMYFLDKGNFRLFLVFFLMVFTVREDIAFCSVFLVPYLIASKKISFKKGMVLFGAALLVIAAIFFTLLSLGKGFANSDRFYYLFPNQAGILALIVTNPLFELITLATQQKAEFILLFSLPLLFMYIFKKENYILLFPALLFTVFSRHMPQYTIGYEYSVFFIFAAFYLSIDYMKNPAAIHLKFFKSNSNLLVFMIVFSLAWNFLYGSFLSKSYKLTWLGENFPFVKANYYYNGWVGCFKKAPNAGYVDYDALRLLGSIPADYSVKVDDNIMPHVSGRKGLYLILSGIDTDFAIVLNHRTYYDLLKNGLLGKNYVKYAETKKIIVFVNTRLKDIKLK